MKLPSIRMKSRSKQRIIAWLYLMILSGLVPATYAADEPLIMGVFPRRNIAETASLFAPMATYLGEQLGREVKLVPSRNFDSFWKEVANQRFDIVHYNQYQYIRSAKHYRVIAHTEEFGKDSVAGVLFVRTDSGITKVSQLRGRTVVFGSSKDAMLAYIAPRYLLSLAGLKEQDFKSAFAVNPQNALVALFYKQADAAGGGEVALDQPVVKSAIDTRKIRILASTEALLFLPWAVKRSMPAKLAESIQTTLLDMKNSDAGKQALKAAIMTGLGRAEDKDYDNHRKIIGAVFGADSIEK